MSQVKKIPCRVCGKMYEPCAYCQAHADVFRWRNFACSIKCAKKYITDTVAYRKHQDSVATKSKHNNDVVDETTSVAHTQKKENKKQQRLTASVDCAEAQNELN